MVEEERRDEVETRQEPDAVAGGGATDGSVEQPEQPPTEGTAESGEESSLREEAAERGEEAPETPAEPSGAEGEAEVAERDAGERAAAQERVPSPVELAADARYSATGKRKSSIARVILKPGSGAFQLNGRTLDDYFPRKTLQEIVRQPLMVTGYLDRVDVHAKIHGGGVSSQADAVCHGISKALIEAQPSLRGELKRRQLLTRDPRVKERRKAGLKKARKRPQFSKR